MSSDRSVIVRKVSLRALDCMAEGWRLVRHDYWILLGVRVVGLLLAGAVFCVIGMVFTTPLVFSCLTLVYRSIFVAPGELGD